MWITEDQDIPPLIFLMIRVNWVFLLWASFNRKRPKQRDWFFSSSIPKCPHMLGTNTGRANRDVNLTFRADIELAEEADGLSLTGSSELSSLSYVRNKKQITEWDV